MAVDENLGGGVHGVRTRPEWESAMQALELVSPAY